MNFTMTSTTLRATTIMAMLALLGPGCIMFKSGGGPVSRADATRITGHTFISVTSEQREAFEQLDQADKAWNHNMPSAISSGIGNSTRIKTASKSNLSFGKIMKCGWVPSHVSAMERINIGDRSEIFCRDETTFIPGYPLIWPVWTTWSSTFVQSSGQQVGSSSCYGLGLGTVLGGKLSIVAPASLDFPAGQTPEQYDAIRMWYLAGGVLGGGRVNHKYYGQFLWLAFPVGSAD